MISQNIKKQIVEQTNIVEVVGEVVKLTKKGSSYFGLCPFHNDKHPSMSVSEKVKMFNCFSCNTKGNVIYFVSRYNNISEDQATIILAKRLGIEISDASSKEALKEERLLKVMNDATNFYEFYLHNTEEGVKAKAYLTSRGITDEIIKDLRIGLASSESNLLNQALKKNNHSELDQVELGLVKIDNKDQAYDVFRNRIIFPIENNNGQVVGFSGRIYTKSDQAKYINSSESAIFHKGQILYNFHKATPAIRSNDKIIIFEGFMDVIAAKKAQISYGVATMGTALTQEHVKNILSLTKNIVLCFDGDSAGIHAMKRSAFVFANYHIIPKAIVLPNNLDPDEYLKAYGSQALNNYFSQNEKNVYQWLYDSAKKDFIKGDLESVERFKKEVFECVRCSKENTIIEHFIKMLASDIEISFESLMNDFGKIANFQPTLKPDDLPKNRVTTPKEVRIKRKIFIAYDVLLKHMVYSKLKFIEFMDKMGDELYIDSSLTTYFEIIKKMEVFYAENELMDEQDFLNIAKSLDLPNETNDYYVFAKRILDNKMINLNDSDEFEQCLNTIQKCWSDLSKTRLYNKALSSGNIEDIQKFESLRKENVKVMSKEEK